MAFESIRIKGDARLKRSLAELAKLGTNKRQVHAVMAVTVEKWARDNFKGEGSKLKTGSWPALSPIYAAKKSEKYPGAQILVQTGRQIRPSLNSEVTTRRAAVGWSSKLARFHGSEAPRKKLPLRRLLPKENEVIDDIVRQVNLLVQKKIRRLS